MPCAKSYPSRPTRDCSSCWRAIPVSSILASRETRVDLEIDTQDFASAAERDESRSRFYVVEGENDLQEILSAPLEQWRVFLHPTQRRLATRNLNGPSRILGGAGTGKTVLAMHRAKHLASTLVGHGQEAPVHDLHDESGAGYRGRPEVDLLAGADEAHRHHQPGCPRVPFPQGTALRA